MKEAILTRGISSDVGTFGTFQWDGGPLLRCVELPWRNNLSGISCVPPAPGAPSVQYVCVPYDSPSHGPCYMLAGVQGRSDVEIHVANWAGDMSKGLKCELRGCIALGTDAGPLDGQMAVLHSQQAFDALMAWAAGENFLLTINASAP